MTDWSELKAELAIWRSEARALPLWWRDDDAIDNTPALQRLLALSADLSLSVHLAVIPAHARPTLAEALAENQMAIPMVHGWTHQNHSPEGQKKAEFGHPRADAPAEAAAGVARLRALFGARLLPVFVPPWNRIDPGLIPPLAPLGYIGLSAFTPRKARLAGPGLVQINTHLDPIDWRGGGGLISPDAQIAALIALLQARRSGSADGSEPLGFLTHHLVHDTGIWAFSRTLLATLLEGGALPCNLHTLRRDLP